MRCLDSRLQVFKLGGGGGGGVNVWNGTLILSFSETCSLGHGLVAVFSLFSTASGYVTIFFFLTKVN